MSTAEGISPLNMTDEEFLNSPEPTDTIIEDNATTTIPEDEPTTDTVPDEKDTEEQEETSDEVTKDSATEEEGKEDTPAENTEKEKLPNDIEDKTETTEKTKVEETSTLTDAQYKEERDRLFSPIKANGGEITLASMDEAISLIQMGANYNKKMGQMKPHLKTIKLLEKNGINDPVKLNYLIDLDKKDPQAIVKLIKDSGIDLQELDIEADNKYTPKTRVVNETEIDLDTVLDDIQDTPTYNRTLKVVSEQWDGESKQAIANQPFILKTLNDQMENGIYDLINVEVERQRMLGGLNGIADIEAYRKIGEEIQARGGFDHLGSSQEQPPKQAPEVIVPKQKVEDPALKEKRKAATSTREAPPGDLSKSNKINPLSMTDEEFMKMG